ncbi:MAG: hypothetical protein UV74_C0002G0011 [Candidatus Woesebacteria bacterium GW2011_GWB1_43_14]|uniref:Uncharacterized protein n=1 Tax=Candidatus Woesebacteria bacterium GW2011_GWB1_43_14 TaxID=1618578 RepID=A0A0G1DMK6_9BACT|nr:MAG: hypothetical protein UV51_C0004G0058 [Candidatus Woesebacteria bacterium GW2011_GWC1_42_9]KKS98792.1 MAG: hypothetical protein UV74_C0002G0011 [Candidatus Woesebacteria bacterium GW2011_GWB1_43_14]
MRKILTYYIFMIASLVVIAMFVTATTYAQLAIGILLFPLLVYYYFKVLPRKTAIQPAVVELPRKVDEDILDIDKRAFLKLVGAAGLSLFLSSIFIKKAEAAFFGSDPGQVSLQDASGNKINPAERQPTDGYRISEIDDSVVAYYGFTNKDGAWFIMKEDTEAGSFRYAKGDSNLASVWDKRKNLKYDYYNNVF